MSAGILKANQNREDRRNKAINSGAKEWIANLKLVETVLDKVDKGEYSAKVTFPSDSEYAKAKSSIRYVQHGAIESDRVYVKQISGKVDQMMADEGVEVEWQTGESRLILRWEKPDGV